MCIIVKVLHFNVRFCHPRKNVLRNFLLDTAQTKWGGFGLSTQIGDGKGVAEGLENYSCSNVADMRLEQSPICVLIRPTM